MAEKCTLREREASESSKIMLDGFLRDTGIPEACISCLWRALDDPSVEKVDSYTEIELGDDVDMDSVDKWQSVGIQSIGDSSCSTRQIVEIAGIDSGDLSETRRTTAIFECYK